MIPEWKMMIIVGFWWMTKFSVRFFSCLERKNFVFAFFPPIWKWTAASEAFHVFPILSHEFFNGFLMSKEGKRDTHKLNDFFSRSFSSPTSSCLSGLILKIWLSIPTVLLCVSQRRKWCEWSWVDWRSKVWWSMIMGFFSSQRAIERKRKTNSWWIIYDDLLSIVVASTATGVHGTFCIFMNDELGLSSQSALESWDWYQNL